MKYLLPQGFVPCSECACGLKQRLEDLGMATTAGQPPNPALIVEGGPDGVEKVTSLTSGMDLTGVFLAVTLFGFADPPVRYADREQPGAAELIAGINAMDAARADDDGQIGWLDTFAREPALVEA